MLTAGKWRHYNGLQQFEMLVDQMKYRKSRARIQIMRLTSIWLGLAVVLTGCQSANDDLDFSSLWSGLTDDFDNQVAYDAPADELCRMMVSVAVAESASGEAPLIDPRLYRGKAVAADCTSALSSAGLAVAKAGTVPYVAIINVPKRLKDGRIVMSIYQTCRSPGDCVGGAIFALQKHDGEWRTEPKPLIYWAI